MDENKKDAYIDLFVLLAMCSVLLYALKMIIN
jgi:hypothetical protein